MVEEVFGFNFIKVIKDHVFLVLKLHVVSTHGGILAKQNQRFRISQMYYKRPQAIWTSP